MAAEARHIATESRAPDAARPRCRAAQDAAPGVMRRGDHGPASAPVGNLMLQSVLRGAPPPRVQLASRVSMPGDPWEQEADRIADAVVSGAPKAADCTCGTGTPCTACGEEPAISRKAAGAGMLVTPPSPDARPPGPGRPLDRTSRSFFESRFGRDFSDVRVHTSHAAAASADALAAEAYTTGRDIVFAHGRYAPESSAGQRLLAHELTHVVQQGAAPAAGGERTADSSRPGVSARGTAPAVMRQTNFTSTFEICHRLLKSRRFSISQGGVVVTANGTWGASEDWQGTEPPACGRDAYHISLTKVGWILDTEYGTCGFPGGVLAARAWGNLPSGEYYLTIWTNNTNPECCMRGDIFVREQAGLPEGCTQQPPGPLEILHTALDMAGMIPELGAIPDAINAGIYAIQGDWTNAGISAVAVVPVLGDTALIDRLGARAVVKVEGREVERLGAEAIADGLKDAKASERAIQGGEHLLSETEREELDYLHMLDEGETGGFTAEGDLVRMHPHGGAREARNIEGLTGEYQSAHGLPQSVGRGIAGYDPLAALATLHERAVHTGMDAFWKEAFIEMRHEGKTTATAKEIYDAIAESIRRSPDLAAGYKESLVLRLQDEMFVEYGLREADVLPLPYRNIKARP